MTDQINFLLTGSTPFSDSNARSKSRSSQSAPSLFAKINSTLNLKANFSSVSAPASVPVSAPVSASVSAPGSVSNPESIPTWNLGSIGVLNQTLIPLVTATPDVIVIDLTGDSDEESSDVILRGVSNNTRSNRADASIIQSRGVGGNATTGFDLINFDFSGYPGGVNGYTGDGGFVPLSPELV